MCTVERLVTGRWRQNCYFVYRERTHALVIDPGADYPAIRAHLERSGLSIKAILCTHAHHDHVGAVSELQDATQAPFYLHSGDRKILGHANLYRNLAGAADVVRTPRVDVDLSSLESLAVGSMTMTVIACPGHTPGGVAFLSAGHLFTGDTLMTDTIGRTDLPGGDRPALLTSVRRLLSLPQDTRVHPGHGPEFRLDSFLAAHQGLWEPRS